MGPTPTVQARKRDRLGSRYARRLRAAGELPAVIYGHEQAPVAVSVNSKDLLTHLNHGQRVFTIDVEGTGAETCLVNELQFDFLGTNVIHVDLTRIDLTERVSIHVSIKLIGKPVGLKTEGAILRLIKDSIGISCLASDVPSEAIAVDVSALEAGEFLTAGEIKLPPGLDLDEEADEPICQISVVKEEEEAPAAEPEAAEPEIIGEKKEEPVAEESAEKE